MASSPHPFEHVLSVGEIDTSFELHFASQPWAEFLLNPRRLRGSDCLMRWSQGLWSEQRLTDAVAKTDRYFAVAYGPSSTAPAGDVRAFELYFERLEAAGLGQVKRPDLLVFERTGRAEVDEILQNLGGAQELPFTPEDDPRMQHLLQHALIAVECENSLWIARQMPDYDRPLTSQRRLGGLPGLKKSAVLPTVIVKQEDRAFLNRWQEEQQVPIHVWHAFYDIAFGITLSHIESLIADGLIQPTVQTFQAPGGATTQKQIFKIYHHYAYPLGETEGEVRLVADAITDANGHILPYVRFVGGSLRLSSDAVQVLDAAVQR